MNIGWVNAIGSQLIESIELYVGGGKGMYCQQCGTLSPDSDPKICKHKLTVLEYDFLRQREPSLKDLTNETIDEYLDDWDYDTIRQDHYYEDMTNDEIDKLIEEDDDYAMYGNELFQTMRTTYEERYGQNLYKHPLCNGTTFKYQEKEGTSIDKQYGDYLSMVEDLKG